MSNGSQEVYRIGAIWLFRRDGAALLQHRDDKPGLEDAGMWVPPGGHAEPGESMHECARRELVEETEYDAPDLQYFKSLDRIDSKGTPYQISYFWCWYDEVQTFVCHEGQELSFVKRPEAPFYLIRPILLDIWDTIIATVNAALEESQT
jgi:8-oxo-dGTP pyrophosphatase MutT (NUDIX family)